MITDTDSGRGIAYELALYYVEVDALIDMRK